jgi:hypothetical protein
MVLEQTLQVVVVVAFLRWVALELSTKVEKVEMEQTLIRLGV